MLRGSRLCVVCEVVAVADGDGNLGLTYAEQLGCQVQRVVCKGYVADADHCRLVGSDTQPINALESLGQEGYVPLDVAADVGLTAVVLHADGGVGKLDVGGGIVYQYADSCRSLRVVLRCGDERCPSSRGGLDGPVAADGHSISCRSCRYRPCELFVGCVGGLHLNQAVEV